MNMDLPHDVRIYEGTMGLLDLLEQRPAIYMHRRREFEALAVFIYGFDAALRWVAHPEFDQTCLSPFGFNEFVARALNVEGWSEAAPHWSGVIRRSTATDEDAIATFFRLRRQFEEGRTPSRPPQPDGGSDPA